MQGTIAVLVALSGIGCHHKSCEVTYAPAYDACYSSCYTPAYDACYSSCYTPAVSACYTTAYESCYSSCYTPAYDACYSSCYTPSHGHKHKRGGGLFSKLFGCHKKAPVCCAPAPVVSACYSSCYSSCYSAPVYGSYTPVYDMGPVVSGPIVSSQFHGDVVIPSKATPQYGSVAPTKVSPQSTGIALPLSTGSSLPQSPPPVPASDVPPPPAGEVAPPPPVDAGSLVPSV